MASSPAPHTRSVRTNRELESIRTKWYMFDKRDPLLAARVAGLNLQGKTQKTLFFTKEIKTTVFILEFTVIGAKYSWQVQRTFDELREFYTTLMTDPLLMRGKELLKTGFPGGKDGESDTMILVERREHIEAFVKEVVANIDFSEYDPLSVFIDAHKHVAWLGSLVNKIVHLYRVYMAKKMLNLRLLRFYSKELMDFVYKMENGVEVYNIDHLFDHSHSHSGRRRKVRPEVYVLWLDVCEEPALSRVCLAPRSVFELPKEHEDERLSNGIFVSDIAEVRRGASAHAFRRYTSRTSSPKLLKRFFTDSSAYRPDRCLAIVGSERTLSLQLLHAPGQNDQSLAGTARPFASGNTHAATPLSSVNAIDRSLFIDMLNLLVLQSLSTNELARRGRRFSRVAPHASVKPSYPNRGVSAKVRGDADKIEKLLVAGIEVDEENFSPHYGTLQITHKRLQYLPDKRALSIKCLESPAAVPVPPPAVPPLSLPQTHTVSASDLEERTSFSDMPGGDDLTSLPRVADPALSESDAEGDSSDYSEYSTEGEVSDGEQTDRESEHLSLSLSLSQLRDSGVSVSAMSDSLMPRWTHDVTTHDRQIDVDDVSEIRPGKISSTIDGGEDTLYVSIIASETILVLPVPTLSVRNNLVRRFQAFVTVHRDYEGLDRDAPGLFQPPFRPSRRAIEREREKARLRETERDAPQSPVSKLDLNEETNPIGVETSSRKSSKKRRDKERERGSAKATPCTPRSAKENSASVSTPPPSTHAQSHVLSHTKSLRSISFIRRSSQSSKGGASSLSESLYSMRGHSLDLQI